MKFSQDFTKDKDYVPEGIQTIFPRNTKRGRLISDHSVNSFSDVVGSYHKQNGTVREKHTFRSSH